MNKKVILFIVIVLNVIGLIYIIFFKNNSKIEIDDNQEIPKEEINNVIDTEDEEKKPDMIDVLKEKAVLDNIKSTYVTGSKGIDFLKASSDANGKGLYIRSGTENDLYPILYYRGDVLDNYLEFAGYLWRIVRTTETGGIKLIYYDVLDNSKERVNKSTFKETSSYPLPIHNGYMYGEKYMWVRGLAGSYGSSVTYSNGSYTLQDNRGGSYNSTHHYACDDRNCTRVRFYYCNYFNGDETGMYFVLENGDDIYKALENMQKGVNDSPIKKTIDDWYKNNLMEYAEYFEDTVFCNDRSNNTYGPDKYVKNGWNPDGGELGHFIYYAPFGRIKYGGNPSLECRKIDAFTVNETDKGNGNLTYPVALLSVDELVMAGAVYKEKSDYYLHNLTMWTLSPKGFYDDVGANLMQIADKGIQDTNPFTKTGVYPSVSLKNGLMLEGDGTKDNPYKRINN